MEEHRSAESEALRFDSSWGLRILSWSRPRDKTKNIFLFLYRAQNLTSLLFCLQPNDLVTPPHRRSTTVSLETYPFIILDSWNVKLKLAIHNFSTKLICGTRIFQINVDLLNMYLCCVIVMIS